ncbi:RluA family pseudouridine synthase [Candidatus Uhrbacteria bacterium]|nr:RluA family pseudouridine synthase [Candidatus Uhrbacteria bacterium]
MKQWTIKAKGAGERLDVFLTEQLVGQTRSALQKLIKDGSVQVNNQQASVHCFLKVGDKIKYRPLSITAKAEAEDDKRTEINDQKAPSPKIIGETADWLVIDKPAGLLVHPDKTYKTGTLVDWLIEHDPKIGRVGENPERPGIIHRLDREVSGLMIVAKTQAAYEALQKQFKERQIEKTYLALVHGELPQNEGDIKFRIARSSTQPRMAARPSQETQGRAAWTHYQVTERFVGATLVEVQILSGRTHQIRAHFHALGYPIMGDALYIRKKTDRNIKAPRIMLQSIALSFVDPKTQEKKSFTLPPDPAFGELQKAIS